MTDLREAAIRLILEQGLDRTTVDQSAAAADVSQRTFFRYFPCKEAVLFESSSAAGLSRHCDNAPPRNLP